MKRISLLSLFIIFAVLDESCLAAGNDDKQEVTYLASVDIVANKTSGNENKKKLTSDDCNTTVKPLSKEVKFSGYIDSRYVYLIITVEKGRYVTGNMFQNGRPTYVYGEYVKGVLYVYDNKGKRYTVINDKKNAPLFECQDLLNKKN